MNVFALSIITPTGKMFEGNIESLTVPTVEGSLGVLANHTPILALLKQGTLNIKQNNTQQNISIKGGVLEVTKNHQALVLADEAVVVPNP